MNSKESINNPFQNEAVIVQLLELRQTNKHEAAEFIYGILEDNIIEAIKDPTPSETKIKTIAKLREYYEELEDWDRCVFLRDLTDDIINATKGQIFNNF